MPTTSHVFASFAAAVIAAAACKAGGEGKVQDSGSRVEVPDRIPAGGALPAADALHAPRPDNVNPEAGANLFGSMNCDGCHGGGGVGWVGPSLADGRWRYGGTDEEIFTSIFYGRPKGMPAYGGVLGTDGVWMLVAYIKAQKPPSVVPTTSWLPGGSAAAEPPPPPAPDSPAAEEKASPSGSGAGPGVGSAGRHAREVRLHRVPRRRSQGRRAVLQGCGRQVPRQGCGGRVGREGEERRIRGLGRGPDDAKSAGPGRGPARCGQVDLIAEVGRPVILSEAKEP